MNADLEVIPTAYDRAVLVENPGGVTGHGHEDPMMPPRAALRWSLTGTHSGWGAFGKPSGA